MKAHMADDLERSNEGITVAENCIKRPAELSRESKVRPQVTNQEEEQLLVDIPTLTEDSDPCVQFKRSARGRTNVEEDKPKKKVVHSFSFKKKVVRFLSCTTGWLLLRSLVLE